MAKILGGIPRMEGQGFSRADIRAHGKARQEERRTLRRHERTRALSVRTAAATVCDTYSRYRIFCVAAQNESSIFVGYEVISCTPA